MGACSVTAERTEGASVSSTTSCWLIIDLIELGGKLHNCWGFLVQTHWSGDLPVQPGPSQCLSMETGTVLLVWGAWRGGNEGGR